ncbi:MAG: SDR family oxidoreductase [Actinomycetaceae bacterium]|nr:SDR family oxidoreductase [Actinomycetaceae bacterium]
MSKFALKPEDYALIADLCSIACKLGEDESLVLQGGGNVSVKAEGPDICGSTVPLLWVKGSGHQMNALTQTGLAPLRLSQVKSLLNSDIGDSQLANALRSCMVDTFAPDPSVETLVHAALPHKVVLHSHADVVLAVTNSSQGAKECEGILAGQILVMDYHMPGIDLGKAVNDLWNSQGTDEVKGIVVRGHGLFTFADTPHNAYTYHQEIVDRYKAYLYDHAPAAAVQDVPHQEISLEEAAQLREKISSLAQMPLLARTLNAPQVLRFLANPNFLDALGKGPVTPDHVLWTRFAPMIGTDLEEYSRKATAYFNANTGRRPDSISQRDQAPRVVAIPGHGIICLARNPEELNGVCRIVEHTMAIIEAASGLGEYRGNSVEHVFDLEYWEYQQAKLHRTQTPKKLRGQVALVTGANSGIGLACAKALRQEGAAIIGLDLNMPDQGTAPDPGWLALQADVTSSQDLDRAIKQGVETFGGIDILVVSAGIFPSSTHLESLALEDFAKTMEVNTTSVADLYTRSYPFLRAALPHGRVVVIASKNVPAPGMGAAAYSSSKAALTQLSRVAALEWASDGIRVNMLHPDAVFDTGLWTPELLASRAEHYGMSVDDYKRRNLLKTEVTSAAVGDLALAMSDGTFRATTGAQIPIDGGNERVI